MVNKSIINYIKNSRSKGMSDKDIKNQLNKVGWKAKDVNQAFNSLDSPPMPEPSARPTSTKNKVDSAPRPEYNTHIPNENSKTSTLAIIALIMAFVMPLIGMILGIIALGKIKKSGEKGKGLAVAAIVIPIILFLLLAVVSLIAMVAYFGMLDTSRYLPERCEFPIILPCVGKANIQSDSVMVTLQNNLDTSISLVEYSVDGCNGQVIFTKDGVDQDFLITEIGRVESFSLLIDGCDFGKTGDNANIDAKLDYIRTDNGIEYSIDANVRGFVS